MTPTPRTLYVHDDLTDETRTRHGADSEAFAGVQALFALLARHAGRIRILLLDDQLTALARGHHAPFALAVGVGDAGERVARQLQARTGWFPVIDRVEVTREENSAGYALSTRGKPPLDVQLAGAAAARSIAVVDDTVFSGLTMRAVLNALGPEPRARAHAFCLRAVLDSLGSVRALCPSAAGFVAPGRLLEDVSFINASGLVRRGAIRRAGRSPLAFYERPEWMRAWFLDEAEAVTARCAELAGLLEEAG